jgi:transcriptional regulator NrdR family protein
MEMIADTAYIFRVVKASQKAEDFSLARLMMSIAASLSHRPAPASADEAYWLAQTVAQNIQATATDTVTVEALSNETWTVVSHFDATAGIQYGARHGLLHNTAQKPRRGRPRIGRRGIG